jgi:hypothetical protein
VKLTSVLIERILRQLAAHAEFRDARAIPDEDPIIPRLNGLFGNHTFFLDDGGLHVVELVEAGPAADPVGRIVTLAGWRDSARLSLAAHKPRPTEFTVVLGSGERGTFDLAS